MECILKNKFIKILKGPIPPLLIVGVWLGCMSYTMVAYYDRQQTIQEIRNEIKHIRQNYQQYENSNY